jgi:hypothetical protein
MGTFIDKGITTHGSVGNTLVNGVNMLLPAEAFSVKPGGVVETLQIGGDLVTHGANVTTYAVEGGKVNVVDIKGQVLAHGAESDAVLVSKKGITPLTNVRAAAKSGKSLVIDEREVTDRTGLSAEYRARTFACGASSLWLPAICRPVFRFRGNRQLPSVSERENAESEAQGGAQQCRGHGG